MTAEDVAVVRQVLAAREAVDREGVYALCDPDVVFVTPKRTLRGLEEIREKLKWGGEPLDHLEREEQEGTLEDLGGGHVRVDTRVVLRWKESGEVAHERHYRSDFIIRAGRVTRWAWGEAEEVERRLKEV